MTKKQLQELMKIVRPAIIAVYGRQPLRLVAYNDMMAYQGAHIGKDVYIGVYGVRTQAGYIAHVESGRVTSLGIGELKI